jgi:hypothetical protein
VGPNAVLAALAYFAVGRSWSPALGAAAFAAGGAQLPAHSLAAATAEAAAAAFRGEKQIEERASQAKLLREIVGDPFEEPVIGGHWSESILKLADAIYTGGDATFALHDALLEASVPTLAQHFRERDHPRGCWALDLILGRDRCG